MEPTEHRDQPWEHENANKQKYGQEFIENYEERKVISPFVSL